MHAAAVVCDECFCRKHHAALLQAAFAESEQLRREEDDDDEPAAHSLESSTCSELMQVIQLLRQAAQGWTFDGNAHAAAAGQYGNQQRVGGWRQRWQQQRL